MIETTRPQRERYLTCAETAKLVRAALKRDFPGVKFSVRSSTYSMGASIDVHWTDGPLTKAVEAVAGQYAGADFDGMIDLKTSSDHWLSPEGRVLPREVNIGHSNGSEVIFPNRPTADAELVHFGADYIFCTRRYTDARTCPCRSEHSRAALIAEAAKDERATVACRGCHGRYYDVARDEFIAYGGRS